MDYRWRRREVVKVRVTWLGMVLVLFLMGHRAILNAYPTLGMTGKVATFIAVVILPMVALVLWRLGLLPPERVAVESRSTGGGNAPDDTDARTAPQEP